MVNIRFYALRAKDCLTGNDLINLWHVLAQDIVDFMRKGFLKAYKYIDSKMIMDLKYPKLTNKNKTLKQIKSEVEENIVIFNIDDEPIIIGEKINHKVVYRTSEEIMVDNQIKYITKPLSDYRPLTGKEINMITRNLFESQPDTYFLPAYRDEIDFFPLLEMFQKDIPPLSEEVKELYFHRDDINRFAEEHCLPMMGSVIDEEIIMMAAQEKESMSGKQIKADNFFTRENRDLWHIGFEGEDVRIKHIDGLLYIGYLLDPLREPGKSISCRDLYQAASGQMPYITISEDEAINQDLHVGSSKQSIGIDKARKICSEEYEELQVKLSLASMEEQEKIKEKMAKLESYLNIKDRIFVDPNDKKVQTNIKKRLDKAYEVISKANMKDMAKYLCNHIKTDDAYGLRYTGSKMWEVTIK